MADQASSDVAVLQAAYAAFNARDADAALAVMATDVTWPRAFKGGFVHGHAAIREYWAEQWAEIDGRVEPVAFHLQPGGGLVVRVHQVVRDLAGAVLADTHVGHAFTLESGLIQSMEVCDPPTVAENQNAQHGAAAAD